ncbi:hypothetical protein SAMN03080618_02910 [Aquamicrobium aerolatum DSM 21857]|uniref:Uncharacterized protein n=1 Tax=Aquamicrobium aerolatum DSM 21857 TaxID=1121003 RepID=A0A1I3R5Y8_9HYPH|nr:hypothetical protein SAMN03080618_02910 [Aquamicrobium aerolatum DSM 21857]
MLTTSSPSPSQTGRRSSPPVIMIRFVTSSLSAIAAVRLLVITVGPCVNAEYGPLPLT